MENNYNWEGSPENKIKMEYFDYDLFDNQIVIQVQKVKIEKDVWCSYKKEALLQAIADLGAPALKIYLYLGSNLHNYTTGLSPAKMKKDIGLSDSSYRRGIAELKEKKYLVYSGIQMLSKNDKDAPKWYFHIEPQ